jgi:hypothetical protein
MDNSISRADVLDTNVGDSISRQDAINLALDYFVEFLGGAFYENEQKELMARFQRLPSAERRGKWIEVERGDDPYVVCSECGDDYTNDDPLELATWVKHYFHYCPNCGAYMGGEDDD